MAESGTSVTVHQDPQEMAMETRQLFHTIAAVELYQAQIEIAHYLELGYLGVADHPDVAREVRMTAHAARTQHLMTSGLMKNFQVTAGHIISTMIPMILDAVDLQDRDIIADSFGQIITLAEDMRKEAIDTRQRYYEIQTKVQENLALVNKKNKFVVDEQQKLKNEMEREKKLAADAKLAKQELDEEREKMDEELTTLRSYRDRWMDQSEMAGKTMGSDDRTFLDGAILPSTSVVGTVINVAANIFSNMFGSNKKEKQFNKMMDALKSSQDAVERTATKKRELLTRIQERRKEALERLQKVKELNQQTASLGNAESLAEAAARLGDVDRQFTRIIVFWENMVAILKFLQSDTKAGEVYLKKIENPAHAERFKSSIERAEKSWKWFGRICNDYVKTCEGDAHVGINKLYNFLSADIDSIGKQERQKRMRELEFKIEENIQDEVKIE